MSRVSVRLPESLHRALRGVAQEAGVSMNSIVTSAIGEKIAALKTVGSLKARAARGDRRAYEAVLAKTADVPPIAEDTLPQMVRKRPMSPTRSN